MKTLKITQDTEIIVEGQKFLLEEGDEITLSEGIISGTMSSILRKILPSDFIKDFKNLAGKDLLLQLINRDEKKAGILQSLFKSKPEEMKSLFS